MWTPNKSQASLKIVGQHLKPSGQNPSRQPQKEKKKTLTLSESRQSENTLSRVRIERSWCPSTAHICDRAGGNLVVRCATSDGRLNRGGHLVQTVDVEQLCGQSVTCLATSLTQDSTVLGVGFIFTAEGSISQLARSRTARPP